MQSVPVFENILTAASDYSSFHAWEVMRCRARRRCAAKILRQKSEVRIVLFMVVKEETSECAG